MAASGSTTRLSASGLRLAIVVSRYNASITRPMFEAARQTFVDLEGDPSDLEVIGVPGAFELTAGAAIAARPERIDGICALGCLIKGETSHDAYIAQAVATGLTQISVDTSVPCAFGVLTTNTPEQAHARAGGALGNKGAEAMLATIEMASLKKAGVSGTRDPFDAAAPDKASQKATH